MKMTTSLICIASGPSLTLDDCLLAKNSKIKTLTVNNSWKIAPWCDYLYAGDQKWWDVFYQDIPKNIEKWTSSIKASEKFNLFHHNIFGPFNSGMRSLMWAMEKGFKKIILLGFDCSIKNGIHWHGSHDISKGLGNPGKLKVKNWSSHFAKVYARAGRLGIDIINCSRYTELGFFRLASLSEVVSEVMHGC